MSPKTQNSGTTSGYDVSVIPLILLIVLIGYGSLYPFAWDFASARPFALSLHGGYPDLIENVLLFLPLGLLLGWRWRALARSRATAAFWLGLALCYAVVLQIAQMYLPRTPALVDVLANLVGYLLGWIIGFVAYIVLERRLARLRDNAVTPDLFALLLLLFWIVAELFPLLPTFDVSSLKENVRLLLGIPFWQPRRTMLHLGMTVIGLGSLTVLARSLRLDTLRVPIGLALAAFVMLGKLIFVGQAPGFSVFLGILAGSVVWLALSRLKDARFMFVVMGVALATYLTYALWPLQLLSSPKPFGWLPFTSALNNSIESVIRSTVFEALCFGALLWAAVRTGALLAGSTTVIVLLALGVEWLQAYIPGRTPETTAAAVAVCVAMLLRAMPPKVTRAG